MPKGIGYSPKVKKKKSSHQTKKKKIKSGIGKPDMLPKRK
jgi:hypothetical protein